MFLHVSVILFTGGGAQPQCMLGYTTLPDQRPPGTRPETPRDQTRAPLRTRHPPDQTPPPRSSTCWEIRATSGRYASYWNAYLYECHLICFKRDFPSLLYNKILLLNTKNKTKQNTETFSQLCVNVLYTGSRLQ